MFISRTISLKLSSKKLIVICVISILLITNLFLLWDVVQHHGTGTQNTERDIVSQDGIVLHEDKHREKSQLEILLRSSRDCASLSVEGDLVYSACTADMDRGMHVVVFNLGTGRVMATRRFDTYYPGADVELIAFLESLSVARVVCIMVMDEASFNLGDKARNKLKQMGSEHILSLGWRDTWIFATKITQSGYTKLAELYSHLEGHDFWGFDLKERFFLRFEKQHKVCSWKQEPVTVLKRRSYFCETYEGYGQLCDCTYPLPIEFFPAALERNGIDNIPVAVIASNRPRYLFRMLRTLLSARGSQPDLITVYIDGSFAEVQDVCNLLRVKYKENQPISSKNARITQHYKATLLHMFDTHPSADFGIIIEEDLDIAPDFFSYFSQTMALLKEDSSLFCISAWNDQGYEHSSEDASLLYRVETMPGLGWMLERRLWSEELEPNWPGPDKFWDWDMWMRTEYIRKGRECIIPDVSRTFHFGQSGLNMNPYFHDIYFKNHAINTDPNARIENVNQLRSDRYEELIHNLIDRSRLLDHNKNPCEADFIPDTKGEVYTLYISIESPDKLDNWLRLAKCLKLWDLDARGFHKGLWRFWLKGNHILVLGAPMSMYVAQHMPTDLVPVLIEETA